MTFLRIFGRYVSYMFAGFVVAAALSVIMVCAILLGARLAGELGAGLFVVLTVGIGLCALFAFLDMPSRKEEVDDGGKGIGGGASPFK